MRRHKQGQEMPSQSDFMTLAVESNSTDENKHASEVFVLNSRCAALIDVKDGKSNSCDEEGSGNFIPDEVYTFMAACKSSKLTTKDLPDDQKSVKVPVIEDMFEPDRRMNDFAAPMRFKRRIARTSTQTMCKSLGSSA